MPERNVFHVMPEADGTWRWRLEDERTSRAFPSREAALADAVRRAERDPNSQVLVHRDEAATEVYRNVELPKGAERLGVKSRLTIGGHPAHPMVIPFPIGFLVLLAVSDVVFFATGNAFWAELSLYLLIGGLVTGALAAVLGLADFITLNAVRRGGAGWLHFFANLIVMVMSFANLMVRFYEPAANVVPAGLTLSIIAACLLVVSGFAGNHLVYTRRIGIEPQSSR